MKEMFQKHFPKKMPLFLMYYLSLLFLEMIFRIVCIKTLFSTSLLYMLLYLLPISFLFSIIGKLGTKKINDVINSILFFLLGFLFSVELVFKNTFKVYFSIRTLGLSSNLTSFWEDTIASIFHNIIYIVLFFIPLVLFLFLRKKISCQRIGKKGLLSSCLMILLGILGFRLSLLIHKDSLNSLYELYYQVDNISLYKEKMGVIASFNLELQRKILGFQSKLLLVDSSVEKKPKEENSNRNPEQLPPKITYNTLPIDFDKIPNQNSTMMQMSEYFKSDLGTKQNDYTGIFKGKNLILFMAESFNSIAVDEYLTPTLYKLTHSSFVFENFYSPVILSTIGGEFQELTGLYPQLDLLSSIWRKKDISYQFGYGNIFKNMGYQVYAYHNNTYNFQNRDHYVKSIGFDNYLGCRNGLESRINCNRWPQSDLELIDATFEDYANSEQPFMVYYVTVSGHFPYEMGNKLAKKHLDKIQNLPYSDAVKAYIGYQMELDEALNSLLTKLEEKGILEDTIIALVGDHYPYDLSISQINEVSSYKRDEVVEVNHSNFILWNSEQETIKIEKVGSQIDVLPTILNVFGAPYDSRLIVGKDILSDTDGLAIFANQSWVSDLGTYYSNKNQFIPKEDVEIPEEYVVNMNKIVRNRINMSKWLLQYNYYNQAMDTMKKS